MENCEIWNVCQSPWESAIHPTHDINDHRKIENKSEISIFQSFSIKKNKK